MLREDNMFHFPSMPTMKAGRGPQTLTCGGHNLFPPGNPEELSISGPRAVSG